MAKRSIAVNLFGLSGTVIWMEKKKRTGNKDVGDPANAHTVRDCAMVQYD